MAGNGKINTVIIGGEMFMATPNQIVWAGSTGLFVVPQNVESTAKPFTPSEVTGGTINYAIAPQPQLIVSKEEEEFASLLVAERKSLARKRIKPTAVNKAIKQVRYRR
jgi:hypothetical protein